MIHGVDISSFQGDVDYSKVSVSQDFVVMKVSEGNGFIDPKFSRNQSEARKAGMLVGYYHFARPDLNNTPAAEADWFLKSTGTLKDGECLFLDYEEHITDPVSWCHAWLSTVYTATGVRPLIYLNQSLVKSFNWKPVIDDNFGLWLAAYLSTTPNTPWPFVAFQQNSSSGKVDGITGNVDTDLFFGDKDGFKSYGYKTPVPTDPCAQIVDENTKLTQDNAKLKVDYQTLLDKYGSDIAAKNADYERLQKTNSDQTLTITNLGKQVTDLTTEKNSIKAIADSLTVQVNDLSAKVSDLTSENKDLNAKLLEGIRGYSKGQLLKAFFGFY